VGEYKQTTHATRRHLPHLERAGATYFVTFTTIERRELSPAARTIILDCCVHDHGVTYFLRTICIMPDHVHMAFKAYDEWRLADITRRIKSVSARLINKLAGSRGSVWQNESFDRIARSGEDLRKKCEYICANPVRAGLVSSVEGWPWIWRSWVEGGEPE
jgi:REP element-mobilizing transposase RayT